MMCYFFVMNLLSKDFLYVIGAFMGVPLGSCIIGGILALFYYSKV